MSSQPNQTTSRACPVGLVRSALQAHQALSRVGGLLYWTRKRSCKSHSFSADVRIQPERHPRAEAVAVEIDTPSTLCLAHTAHETKRNHPMQLSTGLGLGVGLVLYSIRVANGGPRP